MADEFEIKRAERSQARLRLGFSAPSGAGKTHSSLVVARGIVQHLLDVGQLAGTLEGKIGLVDTERRSAQLYSHLVPFDTIELEPPFTTERYIRAQQALERAGCAVIILDTISHAWMGPGGILSLLDKLKGDNPNALAGWIKATPLQDAMVDAMLRSPAHIIATMRSKTSWEIEEKEVRGYKKKVPVRVGMAPIQRPGIEFEFTTLLEMASDTHLARPIKNRCPVFVDGEWVKLTEETGKALARWMLEGAPAPAEAVVSSPLEEAQAIVDAALRGMERATTSPDVVRIFQDAWTRLQPYNGPLAPAAFEAECGRLIAGKNERKRQVPSLASAAPVAQERRGPPEPEGRSPQDVIAGTIEREAARRGGLPFSDMRDDLPWKD